MLVVLLATGSNVFAENSIKKANSKMSEIIFPVIDAALTIGVCTFIGHCIVNSFDATKDMRDKNEIILAACVALYGVLLAVSVYEEIMESLKDKHQEQIA
jgi:hypothetical protein